MTTAPLPNEDGEAGAVARSDSPSVCVNPPWSCAAEAEWLVVGRVAVDSGKLIITDPCTLDDWVADDYAEVAPANGRFPYSYAGACSASGSPQRAGALGSQDIDVDLGVAVQSGAGDGTYPVRVRYGEDGLVAEVRVDFTGEDSNPLRQWSPYMSPGSEATWNRERFLGDMREWVLCSGTVGTDSTDDEVDRFLGSLPPGELQAWADYWVRTFMVEECLHSVCHLAVERATRVDLDLHSAELRRWGHALQDLQWAIQTAREALPNRHEAPSTWRAWTFVVRGYQTHAIPHMQSALELLGYPAVYGMDPTDGLVARALFGGYA